MFFDNAEGYSLSEVITFPDFPYASLPVQPSQIEETRYLQGNPAQVIAVKGNID